MKLIYGTKNNGKIESMQKCLEALTFEFDVEMIGLSELGNSFPDIDENGNNPLDNARAKALAYHGILKKPVFSLDSGLYFDGLPDHLQPGLHIRRVNGKRLTDDEMIAYYSKLAEENGGRLVARYMNGICLVMDDHLIFEHMGEDIATQKFIIASIPHKKRAEGLPLDSLSIHIASNQYFYDMNEGQYNKEDAWHTGKGFYHFFHSALCAISAN